MSAENWYYFAGGLGAFAAILFGVYRLRPEDTKVYIESADRLVGMANTVADMSESVVNDLRERNRILDDRVTELSEKYGQALERLNELESTAARVTELERTVGVLMAGLEDEMSEKARIEEENVKLRERVTELEAEVTLLKNRTNGLTNDLP